MPKSLSFRNEATSDIIDTQRMDKGDEQTCIRFNEKMNKQKDENKRGEANIRDYARMYARHNHCLVVKTWTSP